MKALSEIHRSYKNLNKRLARGEAVCWGDQGPAGPVSVAHGKGTRVLRYPKIGVYVGSGSSHSWLWFAELFDRMGFYDVVFLDENQICQDALKELDVLAMSGGDTFAVAKGLGINGSRKLENFVKGGGLYMGSCAGAYLPLNSSKEHLNLFNFVDVKIANLTRTLPDVKRVPEKFCTVYGCSFIFHPVREEVKIITDWVPPFNGMGSLLAPLYGGPPMIASDGADVLARYEGFTNKTRFLVDEAIAETTMIGRAAAVRSKMGSGCFYLFGPHFEHPHFPFANQLVADAIYWNMRNTPLKTNGHHRNIRVVSGDKVRKFLRDLKRELSNSRIVALGMEMMPVSWLIGMKVYEPAKIRVFLEAMWTKIKTLEKAEQVILTKGQESDLIDDAARITILLREIKTELGRDLDTIHLARDLFKMLNKITRHFLDIYFRSIGATFENKGVQNAL